MDYTYHIVVYNKFKAILQSLLNWDVGFHYTEVPLSQETRYTYGSQSDLANLAIIQLLLVVWCCWYLFHVLFSTLLMLVLLHCCWYHVVGVAAEPEFSFTQDVYSIPESSPVAVVTVELTTLPNFMSQLSDAVEIFITTTTQGSASGRSKYEHNTSSKAEK